MFVSWRRQGNYFYCVILEQTRANGRRTMRSCGYLGRKPVEGLQKLIAEGRITKEQAANLHVKQDPKNLFLRLYVEKLKRELAAGKAQDPPTERERIKAILNFYRQPKRAVRMVKEVLGDG